jgi:hypothetical protein
MYHSLQHIELARMLAREKAQQAHSARTSQPSRRMIRRLRRVKSEPMTERQPRYA